MLVIPVYANIMFINYSMIPILRPIRNYIHLSLCKKMCYFKNQQKSLQIFPYCNVSYSSSCVFFNMDNMRYFSMSLMSSAKSKDRGKDKKKQKLQHVDLNEMQSVIEVDKITSQFEKAIESLKNNFVKYLSVRSSVGAIEELSIKFEGKDYILQELAQVSRKPKLIVLNISTFPQAIPNILESLTKNQMKLNPQQDGTTIYVPIPKITKEHRENLSKNAKAFYVKCCDNIREVRNKHIKMLKQKEGLTKDVAFRVEGYIDILNQQYMSKAEQILETKQKELLGDSE